MPEKFNPEVDPFDPRQERWAGWEKWELIEAEEGDSPVWAHDVSGFVVHTHPALVQRDWEEVHFDNRDGCLTHREAVSILLDHGFVPEVIDA